MKKIFLIIFLILLPQLAGATTIYLTSGTSWTVPSDWNPSNNTIEVIGAGGGGGNGYGGSLTTNGAGGGGGGGYSKITNVSLSAGNPVTYSIGTGGSTNTSGSDTFFCNSTSNCASITDSAVQVGAKGGVGGQPAVQKAPGPGGSGGAAASGVGTIKYSGGAGGTNTVTCSGCGGSGGGGAAGSNGNGAGGSADTGLSGTGAAGGSGDAGSGGSGGTAISIGSGTGTTGVSGSEWDTTHGSGGGGGGGAGYYGTERGTAASNQSGGPGGTYGAGGGGGGSWGAWTTAGGGGNGQQGIIVITYTAYVQPLQCTGSPEIYSTPGTYARGVPTYSSMTVQVWGGGAAGGFSSGSTAAAASSFLGITAGAGATPPGAGTGGTGGIASGGDIDTNGGSGGPGSVDDVPHPELVYGGSSPNGGAGGTVGSGNFPVMGNPGNPPGGGGAGSMVAVSIPQPQRHVIYYSYPGGGAGAYVKKTYSLGALTPGSPISVVVGNGGIPNGSMGGTGASGEVEIMCSASVAPTCSISLDQNPVAYGSGTTLHWSSTNTNTSFYINNVGYVTANTPGSTSVQPSSSTDYTGTAVGSGGTTTCTASSGTPTGTLNVTPPASPTATIQASSTSVYVGVPVNLTATFAAGSGDTLTGDNIDSPVGTGLGANTNAGPKSITFTPSSAGTYTFYARAQTSYYPSWTTYAQVSITATTPPSCTPAYTCSGSTIQYTNAICQVSNVSTCVAPQFCSSGSSTCAIPTPTFNSSGNFTGHLQVVPALVHLGSTTQVYWNVSNVQSCTVTGTNGDSWTGLASPSGGETSSPIQGTTTYTLFCQAYSGANPSTLTETVQVGVPPSFREN